MGKMYRVYSIIERPKQFLAEHRGRVPSRKGRWIQHRSASSAPARQRQAGDAGLGARDASGRRWKARKQPHWALVRKVREVP